VETGLDASAAGTRLHRLRFDLSTVSLVVANLATVGVALAQGWDLAVLMWVYWVQSCTIGLFSFFRMLSPSGWAIMWPAPQVGPASRRDRDEWKRFTLSWGSGPTMC